ncbi:MAG: glycosyltransferase family 2 protein [Lachnospiraceae bacterium]|nr:glycosyltransferase family 2 protein [Lachnospiraceae bacterium]
MIYEKQAGVPRFECNEYHEKTKDYVILIPIINEGDRIIKELKRAFKYGVANYADIVICDGGSTDGCTAESKLKKLKVNALLIKRDIGKQGAQLRMGIWWALRRGYQGVITIDGNNKDSIEDVPRFIDKLKMGYDYVQGSRFIEGGRAIRTPFIRTVSVRFIHAPIISLTAHHKFTDTTNAYRAYSAEYLQDNRVQPLRDIFMTYELLAYLSVRATQIGRKACEIPVTRSYPKSGKVPTKISFLIGNSRLMKILLCNAAGMYAPKEEN